LFFPSFSVVVGPLACEVDRQTGERREEERRGEGTSKRSNTPDKRAHSQRDRKERHARGLPVGSLKPAPP
jgi:hypothetical protein